MNIPGEIMRDPNLEFSEISDYEVGFNHNDFGKDYTHVALHHVPFIVLT